jgi:hypothetical protein
MFLAVYGDSAGRQRGGPACPPSEPAGPLLQSLRLTGHAIMKLRGHFGKRLSPRFKVFAGHYGETVKDPAAAVEHLQHGVASGAVILAL